MLFLDEIGELGSDEQAMLLRAIEDKVFYPMGSDREATSDFQLIAGTNRDLERAIERGEFRDDLFARINLWTFELPGLHQRKEDISPNLDFELARISEAIGTKTTMSREARSAFLRFASSFRWLGNFRDFNASVTRMATFAKGGRITEDVVSDELARLQAGGPRAMTLGRAGGGGRASREAASAGTAGMEEVVRVLGHEATARLDRFDRVQLADVLTVCRHARSLADAGRELFAASRTSRASVNDSDRLRKYLARFGIELADVKRAGAGGASLASE